MVDNCTEASKKFQVKLSVVHQAGLQHCDGLLGEREAHPPNRKIKTTTRYVLSSSVVFVVTCRLAVVACRDTRADSWEEQRTELVRRHNHSKGGTSERGTMPTSTEDAAGVAAVAVAASSSSRAVEKSPNDQRAYRAVVLPNGMKVILISDPDTKISSAALDVHVGYFSDPADDLPGLAHFCEHLLFVGTDKYPDEASYNAHLTSHGGSSNAYTGTEDTVYYFDVSSDHLVGPDDALDRFAQFFIAPQFTASATERELNAIESEDVKDQTSDFWRGLLINNIRANPKHPYSKFGGGNKKSLLDDPAAEGRTAREALLPFFHAHYSAKQMTLVVLGKESLTELQTTVEEKFSPVPNRGSGLRPSLKWIGTVKPFLSDKPLQAFNVVPVKDLRSLEVSWPLSFDTVEDQRNFLDAQPLAFVGSVLAHKGPGSLLSYLKGKGWANELSAGCSSTQDDFTQFEISIDITPEGLQNRFKIMTTVFSYLELMRKEGVPEFLAPELRLMSDLSWRFQDKMEPETLVVWLASNMHSYDIEAAISGPCRLQRYDEALVHHLLDELRVDPPDGSSFSSPLVTVMAKDFEGEATEREIWYGVKYQVESLELYADEWRAPPAIPELKLQGPNPFVPQDLKVIVPDGKLPKPGEPVPPPTVVETLSADGCGWKVMHKLDDIFAQPKAVCYFQLVSPVPVESPRTWAALTLFELCLDEHLNEYTYDARMAGLSYSLSFNLRGVGLSFRGYGDKMPDLIDKVAEAAATYTPSDSVEFERLKDVVRRECSSYNTRQPYQHAKSNAAQASHVPSFTAKEMEATLGSIQLADLRPLASRVLAQAEGLCLMQGNLEDTDIPRYMEGVRRWFEPIPLPEETQSEMRLVKFPHSPSGCGSLLRKPEENESNENSAVYIQFQVSDRTLESRMLATVLMATIEEPFYDSLRTKQQLGYIVASGVSVVEGISAMHLTVQSAERGPPYLTDRCLEFLKEFRQHLVDLNPSKLSDFVEGLVSRTLESDHRLSSEAHRNWTEISSGQLDFDRRRQEVEALRKIYVEDVLRFFDRHVLEGGKERRVLTSEVFSTKHASDLELPLSDVKDAAGLVSDAKKWKGDQEKFPVRARLI
ncbi:unnamed protein product [Pylaiella littoralis]